MIKKMTVCSIYKNVFIKIIAKQININTLDYYRYRRMQPQPSKQSQSSQLYRYRSSQSSQLQPSQLHGSYPSMSKLQPSQLHGSYPKLGRFDDEYGDHGCNDHEYYRFEDRHHQYGGRYKCM